MQRFTISVKDKETQYQSELIRHGVSFEKAAEAAKILASGKTDDILTPEEIQLVNEACRWWLEKHSRLKHLNPLLAKYR
ncbi:hypothetical protein SD81_017200 [Tolypothrix campylonemoides VB511288]|nr:hypothetical protein SD81_017200 [Tolypothrix campylonemoides VB511288]